VTEVWADDMVTRKLAWFPLLDSINSGLIQTFFAYRAYLLCGRKIVIPVSSESVFVQFTCHKRLMPFV